MPASPLILAKRFALFAALWLVLTAGALDGLPFGAAAAAAATWTSHRLLPADRDRLRLHRLPAILPRFLWGSLSGGLDVAARALRPRMPIRPGWVRYRSALPAGLPLVALGGELSLMPGTLAAGTREGDLLLHCLDVGADVVSSVAVEEQRIRGLVAP
ncbi:Na+/H+ antiporter subunit E [Qipengyuania thermophila]|uniref:Na+/H+ antiporter subunit E n=1 Tax=Qipengyuania thermophila TaxID=2509361 RepID=UPI0013ED4936|nr:Na+/H+ antiporter subunit E [Qipengyuania thermophila]